VLRRALSLAPFVIAIGIDTPGLPHTFLEQAREALRDADAVLGPAEDGGFYLLGLRRCPSGLLQDLPWSAENTFSQALARLKASGLSVVLLDRWFDVDRPADLIRLRQLLERGHIDAPETLRALQALRRTAPLQEAVR
jgi:glycosyltransferase A (GT-A) superfamily protein (DUF2064 family)